ncbi:MAG: CoA-binding protein [Clostridia bacterium]|nr:CoA-binding protein [Clostridia bacterium]
MSKANKKKTLVIGASTRPYRYSHTAVNQLIAYGHPVVAIGLRPGKIGETDILTGFPEAEHIHTVTMYVGQTHQPQYYAYILETICPKRIIFNPGTENETFMALARQQGVEVVQNCTLMMLTYGLY